MLKVLMSHWIILMIIFLALLTESTLKSQDMSRTKAQPLPSPTREGSGCALIIPPFFLMS